jgi:hypothetical protein
MLKRSLSELHWITGENEYKIMGLQNGDYLMVAKQWNISFEKYTMFFVQKIRNSFCRFTIEFMKNDIIPFKYYTKNEEE